jgi:putative hydrolase of the HAD superfamily
VRWLRESGRKLALLTNGAGPAQRKKLVRFGLADLFDAVLIEGEQGFGKPDERVYHKALNALGVRASDAWMIGDNLEFDVAAPQQLGIFGVWIDVRGRGVPEDIGVRPDHVVRSLSELRTLIALRV